MKTELIKKLRCPRCLHSDFEVHAELSDVAEIRSGKISCRECKQEFSIDSGILDALCQASDPIRSEQKGWERFAAIEGWLTPPTQYLLELPRPNKPILSDTLHWDVHADNFEMVMGNLSLKGKDLLDVGAGRCWSTKHLTLAGAKCIAMDILAHPGIGLGAADILMRHESVFFERVLGDMNNMPFADEAFDIVFFTGALHHSTNLEKAIAECQRALRPGGMLALTNEACGGFFSNEDVALTDGQTGINEHNYRYTRYVRAFRKCGFYDIRILPDISFKKGRGLGKHRLLNPLFSRLPFQPYAYSCMMFLFGTPLNLLARKGPDDSR